MVPTAASVIDHSVQRIGLVAMPDSASSTHGKTSPMLWRATITAIALIVGSIAAATIAADPADYEFQSLFADTVRPILETYCFACHGAEKREGKLDLTGNSSLAAVAKNHRIWDRVLERLEAEEMPPEKAPRHPTPHERRAVVRQRRVRRLPPVATTLPAAYPAA